MRVRITFSKQGPLRFTGHLDLHKLWERAARRADLPLMYSQGFHPQPRISLAAALPLGFASRAEVLDLRLTEELEVGEISRRLEGILPAGLSVQEVAQVDDALPPLQTLVASSEYEVSFPQDFDAADMVRRVEALLERPSIPRQRRGKPYDLRPLIESLSWHPNETAPSLRMKLAAREGATGRPEEVLDELGLPRDGTRVERTRLVFF